MREMISLLCSVNILLMQKLLDAVTEGYKAAIMMLIWILVLIGLALCINRRKR